MEELRPEYGEGSLADVPGTVMELLGVENDLSSLSEDIIDTDRSFETVVVILVDGLRYDRVEKTDTGFFGEAKEKGSLEKITSVFPSATPATLTTLNTGRRPLGHGLLGWEMYYREFDDHIFTLPFRTREGDSPEDVYGFRPENLFEGSSIYEKLSRSRIDCFSVVDRELEDSEYTGLTSPGAEKVPYYDTADMALKVGEVLSEKDGGEYIYGYTPDVDSVSHLEGPGTEAVKNQVEKISNTLKEILWKALNQKKWKTV
jgi:predicted AlkP superfamily pyrophosphatase or phosphodiesterase